MKDQNELLMNEYNRLDSDLFDLRVTLDEERREKNELKNGLMKILKANGGAIKIENDISLDGLELDILKSEEFNYTIFRLCDKGFKKDQYLPF